MRIFKFRAWNYREKKMYYDVQECEEYCNVCFSDYLDPKYDALMQYTGLKDKNDKEIYEGDIVITKCEVGILKTRINNLEPARVYWEAPAFRFERSTLKSFLSKDYEYEIIGNCFENPELLEANK